MRLISIATSEDGKTIPKPKKPVITLDSDDVMQFIFYQGRNFRVPTEMLKYFADLPEIIERKIQRATENGVFHMYLDGSTGCSYCNYMRNNPVLRAVNEGAIVSASNTDSRESSRCTYEGLWGIKLATIFRHKESGEELRAVASPCVVRDAELVEIIEAGLLDKYETPREFNFFSLSELKANPELEERFRIKPAAVKKREFFRNIWNYILRTH